MLNIQYRWDGINKASPVDGDTPPEYQRNTSPDVGAGSQQLFVHDCRPIEGIRHHLWHSSIRQTSPMWGIFSCWHQTT